MSKSNLEEKNIILIYKGFRCFKGLTNTRLTAGKMKQAFV